MNRPNIRRGNSRQISIDVNLGFQERHDINLFLLIRCEGRVDDEGVTTHGVRRKGVDLPISETSWLIDKVLPWPEDGGPRMTSATYRTRKIADVKARNGAGGDCKLTVPTGTGKGFATSLNMAVRFA